jgi:hypothetical protein
MDRLCSTDGNNILIQKPEGKIPLERPKYSWENDIKMDL